MTRHTKSNQLANGSKGHFKKKWRKLWKIITTMTLTSCWTNQVESTILPKLHITLEIVIGWTKDLVAHRALIAMQVCNVTRRAREEILVGLGKVVADTKTIVILLILMIRLRMLKMPRRETMIVKWLTIVICLAEPINNFDRILKTSARSKIWLNR